jgi:adenylate kinase family enzyme
MIDLNSIDPCSIGLICIIIFIVCIAIIITILCLNKKNIYNGRSDESLVYFTGFGDGPSVWDKVQLLIKKSEFKDIIIIDGGSSENLDTRASEIIETLPEAPYIFVAHSGGALLAMTIQQLIPDKVNKVILIDPTPPSLANNVPNPIPSNIPKPQADAMKMVANSNIDKIFDNVKEYKNIVAIIDVRDSKPKDLEKLSESKDIYSNIIITKNLGHHIHVVNPQLIADLIINDIKTGKSESQIIIHISGPSGVGKTTLGNKLKEHFKGKITVKDFDDIRDEYVKKHIDTSKKWSIDEVKYQKFIDEYIKQNNHKPLVIVGLNDNPLGTKKLYYKIPATHKFYIDIDDNVILQQKCTRFITTDLPKQLDIPDIVQDITQNNERFMKLTIKGLKHECSAKSTFADNNRWKRYYKKQGYKFMTRELIFKHVCDILN